MPNTGRYSGQAGPIHLDRTAGLVLSCVSAGEAV